VDRKSSQRTQEESFYVTFAFFVVKLLLSRVRNDAK